MKKSICLILTMLLAGCATQQPDDDWHWYKPGASPQSFDIDNGQCKAQAFSVPNVSLIQAVLVLNSCMQGKGWQKRANNAVQSPTNVAPASTKPKREII